MSIEVKNLNFSYGHRQVLHDISFSARKGEFLSILGPNGVGKSTLFRCVLGLLSGYTGQVLVDGIDARSFSVRESARHIAYIPQSSHPIFNYSVFDIVLMGRTSGLSTFRSPGKKDTEKCRWALEKIGISHLTDRCFHRLSGGEQQLVLIARALVQDAPILMLDEPTANLDQEAIARLHDEIAGLKRQGRTVVIAEHRLYFLTDLIDQAWYMKQGVLSRRFTREEFQRLTDEGRERLGLRTLSSAPCTLPPAEPAGSGEGLSVEGLTCAFQKREAVFRELSFSVRPGEVVAVTGPNGVGKTTLSRCLCGLLREQAGAVRLHGRPLGRKERQRAAFCVMQDVNHQLFSDSVWGECRISAPDAPDEKIAEVLDRLQLLSFRERHPMALSGGQKQRLAVTTALLSEKPMLIFDEPTSGLDYARMVEVSGVIRDLARQGRIVLVVTHDQEFLQQACDRVLHL